MRFPSNKYVQVFGFLVVLVLLTNCGFKLKQAYSFDADIQTLSIEYRSVDPAFIHALKKSLLAQGIQIQASAPTQLNILNYKTTRQAASVSASNARQTETRITHSVSFSLTQGDTLLISPSSISRSEEYTNDNRNISGKVEEERLLSRALDQELIELLLLRLANYQSTITDTHSGN